jgi:hypothetical protein
VPCRPGPMSCRAFPPMPLWGIRARCPKCGYGFSGGSCEVWPSTHLHPIRCPPAGPVPPERVSAQVGLALLSLNRLEFVLLVPAFVSSLGRRHRLRQFVVHWPLTFLSYLRAFNLAKQSGKGRKGKGRNCGGIHEVYLGTIPTVTSLALSFSPPGAC